jgi:hypothetical protein
MCAARKSTTGVPPCGFRKRYSYLHVYLAPDEVRDEVSLRTKALRPVLAFERAL